MVLGDLGKRMDLAQQYTHTPSFLTVNWVNCFSLILAILIYWILDEAYMYMCDSAIICVNNF